jgi:dephospho-CoA kinase
MRIGITGTIGCGKTLVAHTLSALGAAVIDTDEIARRVVEPGTPGYESVKARWGEAVLGPDGELDRKKLGEIVFGDAAQLRELNNVLHPLIGAATAQAIRSVPPDRVTVLVVPLMYESGFDALVDTVWVVAADEERVIDRIVRRDGISEAEARARIASQMPQEEKIRRANVVIRNTGAIEDTRRQVVEEWNRIGKT